MQNIPEKGVSGIDCTNLGAFCERGVTECQPLLRASDGLSKNRSAAPADRGGSGHTNTLCPQAEPNRQKTKAQDNERTCTLVMGRRRRSASGIRCQQRTKSPRSTPHNCQRQAIAGHQATNAKAAFVGDPAPRGATLSRPSTPISARSALIGTPAAGLVFRCLYHPLGQRQVHAHASPRTEWQRRAQAVLERGTLVPGDNLA